MSDTPRAIAQRIIDVLAERLVALPVQVETDLAALVALAEAAIPGEEFDEQ